MRIRLAALLPLLALATACGDNKPDTQEPGMATQAPAKETMPMAMPRSSSPSGARVYFVSPEDGSVNTSPVHLVFGLDGMSVVPAGTEASNGGHHHVIVDAPLPDLDMPIPADAHHVHFGDGRTETDMELAPGEHSLQLLLGDHLHIPHQPPVYSGRITITVE
jgi:hypothetical protein